MGVLAGVSGAGEGDGGSSPTTPSAGAKGDASTPGEETETADRCDSAGESAALMSVAASGAGEGLRRNGARTPFHLRMGAWKAVGQPHGWAAETGGVQRETLQATCTQVLRTCCSISKLTMHSPRGVAAEPRSPSNG